MTTHYRVGKSKEGQRGVYGIELAPGKTTRTVDGEVYVIGKNGELRRASGVKRMTKKQRRAARRAGKQEKKETPN